VAHHILGTVDSHLEGSYAPCNVDEDDTMGDTHVGAL